MKYKDADAAFRDTPGYFIWECIKVIALTTAPLHRRHNIIGEDRESQNLATAVGRKGNAHWTTFVQNYENTGRVGFCINCTSEHCPINRQQICRILALYQMTNRLFAHHDEMFVTDFAVDRRDIEIFLAHFVRPSGNSNRFVKFNRQTVPSFRDYPEGIYAGEIIDITRLVRPVVE